MCDGAEAYNKMWHGRVIVAGQGVTRLPLLLSNGPEGRLNAEMG